MCVRSPGTKEAPPTSLEELRSHYCKDFPIFQKTVFDEISVTKVQVLEQMQLKSAGKMSLIRFLMPWQGPLSASLAQVTDRVLLLQNIAAFQDSRPPPFICLPLLRSELH